MSNVKIKTWHIITFFFLLLIGQAVFFHFRERSLRKELNREYESQKKQLNREIKYMEAEKQRYKEKADSLLQITPEAETKIKGIYEKAEQKKSDVSRSNNADSIRRRITERYRQRLL
jgi:predicted Holliday junction resolvase-like endonuclease